MIIQKLEGSIMHIHHAYWLKPELLGQAQDLFEEIFVGKSRNIFIKIQDSIANVIRAMYLCLQVFYVLVLFHLFILKIYNAVVTKLHSGLQFIPGDILDDINNTISYPFCEVKTPSNWDLLNQQHINIHSYLYVVCQIRRGKKLGDTLSMLMR